MAAIKKQKAYNSRHFGPVNIYRNVILRTIGAIRVTKRPAIKGVFRPRLKIKRSGL
jgi:hypothetical protein